MQGGKIMNKKHKFAVLAAAAVLSISMLAGCGNNDDTSQNIGDNNAADSSGTLLSPSRECSLLAVP